jgi:hypothetical protein
MSRICCRKVVAVGFAPDFHKKILSIITAEFTPLLRCGDIVPAQFCLQSENIDELINNDINFKQRLFTDVAREDELSMKHAKLKYTRI